ncbi:peptidoglycan-binding protein [uncultured Roseivirga sp.]|uniref:peptidoglycan-binding protein n=1 Tax=uncultured Roseivirga sp. TaxID=543088 RepID=UPI0030D8F94C|tara:strand:- start:341540 stop:342169 length:630 start_codon:yes stop_codon:yes gene_type:complete
MKRLLVIVVLIGIIAYITVQYLKDRRFNPPSAYDYELSENIDTDFYDPEVLKNYYKTALEVGSYARSLWRNDQIDVRFINDEDFESTRATDVYNEMITTAKMLQAKLERSAELKSQGYSNYEVQMYFEQSVTPEDLKFDRHYSLLNLKIGAKGAAVWELQKLLNQNADSIPQDGIFNLITANRLKTFQQNNGLFPSGEVDEKTLKALIK